jgi:uncharacterized membrane protein
MIVHFPIALLFVGVVIDVAGLVLRDRPFWRGGALIFYVCGALGALAAYLSGDAAADSVFLPSGANAVLTEHSNLGTWTLWFFGVYAVARAAMYVMKLDVRTPLRIGLVVVAAGGLFLVYETGEHGAEMVFRYGVGVQAVDASPTVVLPATDSTGTAGPVPAEEGGWSWKPARASAWMSAVDITPEGAPGLTTSLRDGGERGDVLALTTDGSPVMITFDQTLETIQVDAALDVSEFDGSVMFVNHVQDADNYYFTALVDGEMRLGRSENGDLYMLEEHEFDATGWHTYRVVGDGEHFRSYADETLLTHGHAGGAQPGSVGIRLNGTGTVLLDYIQVRPVR